ncbi:enoyl-CoA hydratase/isomerase family protein [Bradyrhizobium sp. GCM10027634]|uniref:enoyl-CoA hydratase/isomerase family protein n=1 Tax=unclassified Bradyrhizobium TaxID=2631580 RepID=UPI00263B850A|nr:enoyl-CoA hydratase/isomerase family protein [Bradyrhizobium sp. WYCCWR 12677]MDN5005487.1 enoyl-CoA hydratase/isomerase family protein [Bradyrhizobium sp. WYCCWR 12677]
MSQTQLIFDGSLAVLSLVRPGGNRISFEMRRELRDALQQIAESSARALLVRGEGSDFCLGGDVREWPNVPVDELRPKIEVFAEALDQMGRLDIPTLAAVQGGCAGGGLELALACDMIVAGQSAWFSCPEATLGILTLQGGMLQLAERVGRSRAAELVFLSERVSATQMCAWNVVNRVVDDALLEQTARALAARLASGPTRAYAATKSLWRLQAESGERAAREALYDRSMPLFETEDAKTALKGAAKALEKGWPRPKMTFQGR